MFDTHAHVHDPAFDLDREQMLVRAKEAGIDRILTVGTDLADSGRARSVAELYGLDYAVGVHPHEAKDAPADLDPALEAFWGDGARVPRALGEMGLDYFYDHSPRGDQRRVLVAQLRFARRRGLPAIFHLRDAFEDFLAILRAEFVPPMQGVVHCFAGDERQARTLVEEFGLRLGIGGILTFRNAQALRDALLAVGLDRVILETDCPYLAPVPHRGRRNEPSFMADTAKALAELFGVSAEDVMTRTTANAESLFGA
ncbi:MAG: TatD family hydrolase [Candidatus Baltobacteraceae bacterium]|jgi:TatD DNase family protein